MAVRGVDQLSRDPHPVAGTPHAAFEHVANAEFARHPGNINRRSLVGECRIARDDKNARLRDGAVMMSSTMPSAKYSCSASPLKFWNGRIAIDGFSGRAGTGTACVSSDGGPEDRGPTRYTLTGRAMFLTCCSP